MPKQPGLDAKRSKRWRENHPDYKDPTRNERAKRYYDKHRKVQNKKLCSICGKPLRAKSFGHQIGFHRKCNEPKYMRFWRESKKK